MKHVAQVFLALTGLAALALVLYFAEMERMQDRHLCGTPFKLEACEPNGR